MADNKKKRPFRKEYYNYFQRDLNGNYIYMGPHMVYSGKEGEWSKSIILLWVCVLVPFAALIVQGLIPAAVLGNPWLTIPYLLEFIALFVMGWKLVRFTYARKKIRKYIYEQTWEILPGFAIAAIITAAIALAGALVSIIGRTAPESTALRIVLIAQPVIFALFNLIFIKIIRKMKFEEEPA